jgi:sugar lactone lactonase YvrE
MPEACRAKGFSMNSVSFRIVLGLFFLNLVACSGFAQSGYTGIIGTVAGTGTAGFGGDGGLATAAQLNRPTGVAVDSAGNLYFADYSSFRIRKVSTAGVISTVAGTGTAGFSGDGGLAAAAQLDRAIDVAVDSSGNLYIADTNNNRIRKVSATGIISTVAGTGTAGFGGDGGLATAAQLNGPVDVAVDSLGILYIADANNNRIRKVSAAGIMTTVAGNGTPGFGGDGGLATAAQLNGPQFGAIDSSGNLYIADFGNKRIRKVTPTGIISTAAGNGTTGFSGDGGLATAAQLDRPQCVAVDSAGTLYISDFGNNRVRKVTPAGIISTVAGGGVSGLGDGGLATAAQLNGPAGVAVDSAGSLYIGDYLNNRIRKVSDSALYFAQLVVGGGYSTSFSFTNTGSTAQSGNLTFRDQQGTSFNVSATIVDLLGITSSIPNTSTVPLTIPSGGTVFVKAEGVTAGSSAKAGWARLEANGESLSGVATYEYVVGDTLYTMVGVLHSRPLTYATIPVDNDDSQSKQAALAIANPSDQSISVRLALVAQNGNLVEDFLLPSIGPREQVAQYLYDWTNRHDFKGSLIVRGVNGATFVAVPLCDKQSVLTALPLISGKAPGLPN